MKKRKLNVAFLQKISSAKKKAVRILEDKMKQDNPTKKKIAFICVHNSCRSQIAESLATTGKSDEEFIKVINIIEEKVRSLK